MSYFYNMQSQQSSSTSAEYIFLSCHSQESSQTSHLRFLKCPYLLCCFPKAQYPEASHSHILSLLILPHSFHTLKYLYFKLLAGLLDPNKSFVLLGDEKLPAGAWYFFLDLSLLHFCCDRSAYCIANAIQ